MLETQELAKAVKLASFFASASSNIVRLTFESGGELSPGKLTISANAAEVGDNTGELDGMVHGDGGQIALNVKFLSEALGLALLSCSRTPLSSAVGLPTITQAKTPFSSAFGLPLLSKPLRPARLRALLESMLALPTVG